MDESRRLLQRLFLDGTALLQDLRQREYRMCARLIRAITNLEEIRTSLGPLGIASPSSDSSQRALESSVEQALGRLKRLQTLLKASASEITDSSSNDDRNHSTSPRIDITDDADSLARLQVILRQQQDQLASTLEAISKEEDLLREISAGLELASLGGHSLL